MERRCLVLAFNFHNKVASCYYKENLEFILVQIGNGIRPLPGQFLVFNSELPPKGDELLKTVNARVEEPTKDDCIEKNADGTFQISAWIAFSSDSRHQTFERNLAFSDWYGFIDSSKVDVDAIHKKCDAYTSFITVKDLNYKKNKTQLFKVSLIKRPLDKGRDRCKKEELVEKMKSEEEKLLVPKRPVRRIDNGARPGHRNYDTGGPIDVGAHLANLGFFTPSSFEAPPAQSSVGLGTRTVVSTVAPIATSTTNSSFIPNRYNDNALIIRQESNDCYVAWLTERKVAARLSLSRVGLVRLGTMYKCSYEQKEDESYEIIEIEKALEYLPFQIIELGGVVKAKIRVNLCSPNTKCFVWSFHMGTPFLNSLDVGVVTIADVVDTPLERNNTWQEALREYLGETSAENMLCVCELVEQKVPKKLTNSFSMDDFLSESRYMWQVKTICSTDKHHEFRENQLKNENLGSNADEYAEEDDIARAKRENRNRIRFGPDEVREFSNEQPCSSATSRFN